MDGESSIPDVALLSPILVQSVAGQRMFVACVESYRLTVS